MFKHEFNGSGNHRIVQVDKLGNAINASDWVGYQAIAVLRGGGKSVIAVTDFHRGCGLEAERIYRVEVE